MGELTSDQREQLLKPIKSKRVLYAQGMAHLPAYDVIAHLTRIFGFEGWDKEILTLECVAQNSVTYTKDGQEKKGYDVTYRCTMRLTIFDTRMMNAFVPRPERIIKVIEDGATGSAHHMPDYGDAHDFAMKNAISYAIKRCAKDLGDQFGLSLYNKGSTAALVQAVIPYELVTDGREPDTDVPEPMSMGNDERDQEQLSLTGAEDDY
jgi:recombination DNA repair RAD52 pathway protein